MLIETKIDPRSSNITVRNKAWSLKTKRTQINNADASHAAVKEFLERFYGLTGADVPKPVFHKGVTPNTYIYIFLTLVDVDV